MASDEPTDSLSRSDSVSVRVVKAIVPGDLPSRSTLLFLSRIANDDYFVTRPGSSHEIWNGVVRKLGMSVEAAVVEIRAARRRPGR